MPGISWKSHFPMASGPWLTLASFSDSLYLVLDGPKVQENEDNLAVLHAAQDSLKLIRNKFLPAACSWVQVRPGSCSSLVNLPGREARQNENVKGGNSELGRDEHLSL